jgi:hypothetical protein
MPCGLGVHWDVKGRRWHSYSPMCCRRSDSLRKSQPNRIRRVFVGKNREQSWIKYAGDDR